MKWKHLVRFERGLLPLLIVLIEGTKRTLVLLGHEEGAVRRRAEAWLLVSLHIRDQIKVELRLDCPRWIWSASFGSSTLVLLEFLPFWLSLASWLQSLSSHVSERLAQAVCTCLSVGTLRRCHVE